MLRPIVVDLIEHHHSVSGARFLDGLNDVARQRSDISPAMWAQAFTGINMTQARAMLKAGWRELHVKAGGSFTILDRQVYFKEVTPGADGQRVLPFQSTGNQIVLSPEISLSLPVVPHVYFRPRVIYNTVIRNDDNIIKLPLFFVNAQLAYEHVVFKSKLQFHLGADFHWRSTYQSLGYDTPTQSFYVQERYYTKAFPIVDVFFVGKMSRFRFFVLKSVLQLLLLAMTIVWSVI